MIKLSIKARVTLWYTILMVLIVTLVLGFMYMVSSNVVKSDTKKQLVKEINNARNSIEYNNKLKIKNNFKFYNNGIYILFYDSDFKLLEGQPPVGFNDAVTFEDGDMRTDVINNEKFYIYDKLEDFNGRDSIWVRGITSAKSSANTESLIIKLSFIALPFIIILAAVGGYLITKKSFKPIEEINSAVNKINEGKDLTKRIALGKGNDEIYQLAEIFDKMFERLEKSFEAEKNFTSDVSHELRTPISVILAQCEFYLNNESTKDEYKEALDIINRQASKMSRLVSQLLSFTRLEQGLEKANFEKTDISELLMIIVEEQKEIHKEQNIAITSDIEPGTIIKVDLYLFTRMISNLINNAFQFGKDGGYVNITLKVDKDLVNLTISDNGIGISEENKTKIWQRFYQVNQSRYSGDKGGMGLGLAMVKQIVEIHGGSVTAESKIGEGSSFIIYFPRG